MLLYLPYTDCGCGMVDCGAVGGGACGGAYVDGADAAGVGEGVDPTSRQRVTLQTLHRSTCDDIMLQHTT